MSSVDNIQAAIESLSEDECRRLWSWFSEREWQKWDNLIQEDSALGKLDFLINEARETKAKGQLQDL
ncbi:MAG: hypothetical protein O2999_14960 [Nitrospirae bacterium]|nr:hypothetical protein [Nitrospirota bacterium]MDA1305560.1 hypothetical protein [Nitrospirota bacterium]